MRIKVKVAIASQLAKARVEAETVCGRCFDDIFAGEVLRYCIRKLKRIGQTEEYLPLLYRCELVQHHQMKAFSSSNYQSEEKGEFLCVNIA